MKNTTISILIGSILSAIPITIKAQTDFVSRAELGFAICKISQKLQQLNPRIAVFQTHYFYAGHHQRLRNTNIQNNTTGMNLSDFEAVIAYSFKNGLERKNGWIEMTILEIGYKHPIASTENYSRFYSYHEFKRIYNTTQRLRLNISFGIYNELFYSREYHTFNYICVQWGAGIEFTVSNQFDLFAKIGGRHRILTDSYGRDIMPSHEMQANIGLIYNIRKCDNFRFPSSQPRRRF